MIAPRLPLRVPGRTGTRPGAVKWIPPLIITDDIDECTVGTDNCDVNASCTNAVGSFTCSCNAGFVGDGVICTDIDECAAGTDNCDMNATCTNTVG